MTLMSSPLKSPFENYYREQETNRAHQHGTLRKRRRDCPEEDACTFAWNPTEHKRIRKDVESIYKTTLQILQKNASKQTIVVHTPTHSFDWERVKEPSDGTPCNICVTYTIEHGICEVCRSRTCENCMFQCEICAQVCCNVCKLTRYYDKHGETQYCPDCL